MSISRTNQWSSPWLSRTGDTGTDLAGALRDSLAGFQPGSGRSVRLGKEELRERKKERKIELLRLSSAGDYFNLSVLKCNE